ERFKRTVAARREKCGRGQLLPLGEVLEKSGSTPARREERMRFRERRKQRRLQIGLVAHLTLERQGNVPKGDALRFYRRGEPALQIYIQDLVAEQHEEKNRH